MVKTREIRKMEKKWYKMHTGGFNPFRMIGSWIGVVLAIIFGKTVWDLVLGFLLGWIVHATIRHYKHKHKKFK